MNSTIYGRIGRDAELKETNSGTKVANFSIALSFYAKDGNGVTWADAALFGNKAESLAPYLLKGTSVALSGDIKLRTYDSERDGGTKTKLEINVSDVALLGSSQGQQTSGNTRAAAAPSRPPTARIPTELDDPDIPF